MAIFSAFFLHPRIPSSLKEESPINMLRHSVILTVISRCQFGVHGVEEFEVFTTRGHHANERQQMLQNQSLTFSEACSRY